MLNKTVLVLDSSQISAYLMCPQKWYNQYVRRLVKVGTPPSTEAMDAGTYMHKLLDIYYKGKVLCRPLNDILHDCIQYNPDIDMCECGCDVNVHKFMPELGISECNNCCKCASFRPHPFPLSNAIRQTVRDRFKDYVYKYQTNDFVPHSVKHVETGFSELVYEDSEHIFVLEGRIDLLATLQGLPLIVDHKSQMQIHWLYPKSVQFKNYALVSKCSTFVINYIRLHKQITPETLYREIVNFSAPELRGWRTELIRIYFKIASALKTGVLERNWDSCKGYSKTFKRDAPSWCIYDTLCTEWDEQMRQKKEEALYKIQEKIWKPW